MFGETELRFGMTGACAMRIQKNMMPCWCQEMAPWKCQKMRSWWCEECCDAASDPHARRWIQLADKFPTSELQMDHTLDSSWFWSDLQCEWLSNPWFRSYTSREICWKHTKHVLLYSLKHGSCELSSTGTGKLSQIGPVSCLQLFHHLFSNYSTILSPMVPGSFLQQVP